MTHVGYLIAGYAITFGAVGSYVALLGLRRRALARDLSDKRPSGSST
ncbi:MAG: CcmD family protein [Actinomycetota bacterium]|nr:CcmD family protein [Actinomycetota bacterium]